jgi:hypothetical protein
VRSADTLAVTALAAHPANEGLSAHQSKPDRQSSSCSPIAHLELLQDALNMVSSCHLSDLQPFSDLAIGQAIGEERQNLQFSSAQRI